MTVYWIETGSGKRLAIDASVPAGQVPTSAAPGLGVAHWSTCKDAQRFRRPRS
jgi:hypothetical protein